MTYRATWCKSARFVLDFRRKLIKSQFLAVGEHHKSLGFIHKHILSVLNIILTDGWKILFLPLLKNRKNVFVDIDTFYNMLCSCYLLWFKLKKRFCNKRTITNKTKSYPKSVNKSKRTLPIQS